VVAALDSVTFSPSPVTSQGRTVMTITLTAAAPSGGASVSLSSSNTDLAQVSSNVSIPAGSTSNTVNIDVKTAERDTTVTITASYSSVTKTGTFTVTPTPLDPRFTVISRTRGADACAIDGDDGHLDCEFNGNRSFGAIAEWIWRLEIGGNNYEKTTTSGIVELSAGCGSLDGGTLKDDAADMVVKLRLVGKNGAQSSTLSRTIKLYPQKNCGYSQ
jgi:hypothetical protein